MLRQPVSGCKGGGSQFGGARERARFAAPFGDVALHDLPLLKPTSHNHALTLTHMHMHRRPINTQADRDAGQGAAGIQGLLRVPGLLHVSAWGYC